MDSLDGGRPVQQGPRVLGGIVAFPALIAEFKAAGLQKEAQHIWRRMDLLVQVDIAPWM